MAAAEISQLRCESHGLMGIGNGNLCFHVCEAVPFAKDQTPLCRKPGYCPVKMKPDQKEVFQLLLGLPINPLYLRLARTSPFRFSPEKGQAPGMVRSKLTTILSPNTQERHPPSSCLLQVLFFPALSSPLARLLAWLERVEEKKKKSFKSHWHASPESIFGERLFFFQNKKATGKNRQYWGVGVCFSFGQVCLLSCPANVTTTALWGKSAAKTREEKCFPCKTIAKTMDSHLYPCHLATKLTCFPLGGHLLMFQALLCFDLVFTPL